MKFYAYVYVPLPMGWPGIYSRCSSQLEGEKDFLLLDGGFAYLIPVRLIRDN